jgi:hypothetical protein
VTRSRMTGKARMGATVTVSPGGSVSMRVMHMSDGRPLISAEQEPHLPALQFQRQARSGASVAWTRWMTSRTTSPSWAGITYSVNSPPVSSPRQTRMVTSPLWLLRMISSAISSPPRVAPSGRPASPGPARADW